MIRLMISLIVVPLYTFLWLWGFPSFVGWLLWLIQKAFGRLSAKSTYLRRRVFVTIWLAMTLFFLIANIYGIYGIYQVPFTPESSRVLTDLFTGCVIELLAVAIASLPLILTVKDDVFEFTSQKFLSCLYTPYSKLSSEKIKDLEEIFKK